MKHYWTIIHLRCVTNIDDARCGTVSSVRRDCLGVEHSARGCLVISSVALHWPPRRANYDIFFWLTNLILNHLFERIFVWRCRYYYIICKHSIVIRFWIIRCYVIRREKHESKILYPVVCIISIGSHSVGACAGYSRPHTPQLVTLFLYSWIY